MPRINPQLVNFLALKLRYEIGFTVPIFFQVFLIIQLFCSPFGFIQTNRKQLKAAKLSIFKRCLRYYLNDSVCSKHFHMPEWWDNSQQLHRHKFVEAILNRSDSFKKKQFRVLYNSAKHGMSNTTFHTLCDRQGPTMTIFTLNEKIVVGILSKPWNYLDNGWHEDHKLQLFIVNPDGTTVDLISRCWIELIGFYNQFSLGPAFTGLPVDLSCKSTGVYFKQRKLITGGEYNQAKIDSVVVLQISKSISPAILTRLARVVAP